MVRLFEKIVLDDAKLAKIALEERLIFIFEENGMNTFYHKSVVDKIMEIKPTGLQFIKVSEYGKGAYWE